MPRKKSTPDSAAPSTRERILIAAERLFADRGYNGVSVRDIASEAQVSLGMIRYHFESKENLLLQVFRRLMGPIREERKRRVTQLLQSCNGKQPDLGSLLEGILTPAFKLGRKNDTYRKLVGRSSTDPTLEIRRMYNKQFERSPLSAHRLLREACPHLSREEFYWRYFCYYGAMHYVLADVGRMQMIAGKDFDTSDPDIALKYVIPFFKAALSAPATDQPRPKPKRSQTRRIAT